MEQAEYEKQIAAAVKKVPYGEAIQTADIAGGLTEEFTLSYEQAKSQTNAKLKCMAGKGEIELIQEDLYCHVTQGSFGRVTPDIDHLLIKILIRQNGVRIGYESGASLCNKLGLSTLIPRDIEITTNRYNKKLPEGCHIRMRKPPVTVTNENWKYLQFLDLFIGLPDVHTDVEKPERLLIRYAQQLDSQTLIFTARSFYPHKIIRPLIDLRKEAGTE